MPSNKHILLVCYSFPPYPGIGGRRWAKFAKYLAREGYHIHVICAAAEGDPGESKWAKDVSHPKIHTYPVPSNYPDIRPQSSLLGKLSNRWKIFQLKRQSKGTIYDKSIYWKAGLLKQAKALIEEYAIQHLIATGAPFHTFHHLLDLKPIFPDLQYLIDYRDPWTSAVVYGMRELEPNRMNFEKQIERKVLQQADVIMGPTHPEVLLPAAVKHAGEHSTVCELQHAFDPEDLPETQSHTPDSDKIRLIYGGALYVGVDKHLKSLVDALDEMATTHPKVYQRLEFHFYSQDTHYRSLFEEKHGDRVQFFKPIAAKDIYQKVADSDICMLFLGYHNKHFRTTKFFEFLTLRKPFLLLGDKGNVADYIEQESLGAALVGEEINATSLAKLLPQLAAKEGYNQGFAVDQFSYPAITQQLIHLFHNPNVSNYSERVSHSPTINP